MFGTFHDTLFQYKRYLHEDGCDVRTADAVGRELTRLLGVLLVMRLKCEWWGHTVGCWLISVHSVNTRWSDWPASDDGHGRRRSQCLFVSWPECEASTSSISV